MTRRARRITRREFVGGAVAAAGVIAGAPAILRGRNLNDKLNIAMIGVGGRGAANLKGVGAENVVALCDVNRLAVEAAAAQHPASAEVLRPAQGVRPRQRLRRRRREHVRAHPRVLDDARARGRQARLLRETAGLQHLGDAPDSREGGHCQGGHADGHPNPRGRQLPSRRGARAKRSDWTRSGSARLGRTHVGPAEQRGRRSQQGRRLRHRAAGPRAGAARARLGPLAGPGAGATVQLGVRPRTEMVSLVGLRQRHDERPRQSLERPALLGARAARAADHRSDRRAAAIPRSRRRR